MDIYQYNLSGGIIKSKIFKDVYSNGVDDSYVIKEMDDLGGWHFFELPGVNTDELVFHFGMSGNRYLNYTEEKSEKYLKEVFKKELEAKRDKQNRINKSKIEFIEYELDKLEGDLDAEDKNEG